MQKLYIIGYAALREMIIFSFFKKPLEMSDHRTAERSQLAEILVMSYSIYYKFGVAGNTSGIEEEPSRNRESMFTDALIVR